MIPSKILVFSIIAGLAAALMAALALTRPGLLTLLIYVSSVPVFFASLGWGSLAGIIAAIVATISTGAAGGFAIAAIVGLTIVGPAAFAGHMAGLSRTDNDGSVFWFPISEILFRLTLAIAAAYIALGIWFGYDVSLVSSQIEMFMRQVLAAQPSTPNVVDGEVLQANADLYASLLPLIIPAFSLVILVWNMSIAERLVRKRMGMKRPKDIIAADSGLPRSALIIFAAALVAAIAIPSLQSIAYVISGTMGMAIAMIGLAVMHYFTWGIKARSQILFFAYILLIAVSLPIFLFLIVGLVELLLLLRARDPNRIPPNSNKPDNNKTVH
jgi:hypothetical protein